MKKNILITGGTSGIGKEIASIYLHEGYTLYIVTSQNFENTPNINYIKSDLAEFNIDSMFMLERALGNIDKFERIVLAAGKCEWGDFFNIDNQLDYKQFNLNFSINVFLLKKIRRQLIPSSKILFVSSTSSFSPISDQLIYSISKQSLNLLFEGLYYQLKADGISSTLLIPSSTDTAFWNSRLHKNRSSFAKAKDIAIKAVTDFEKGKKYSTPTLLATIQLYASLFFSFVLVTKLKNLIRK